MSVRTIVGAINHALKTEMALDPAAIVFGEDVGREGCVFRATVGLQESYGTERCFDTPLTEGGIVGAAVGMAVAGLKPVVEIQFSGFSYPAFDQLVNHASRLRNRTRGAMEVPLVVRMPYGGGIGAPEHHSESPEALFAHFPGLKVVIPSTPHDAKGLLIAAVRDPDPVIFMEPKRIYRSLKQEIPSPRSGFIRKLGAEPDQLIRVGEILAQIEIADGKGGGGEREAVSPAQRLVRRRAEDRRPSG